MPVDSAFDREIDPVSCMLYPANVTEPVIQCGKRQGLVCLQAYGVMVISGVMCAVVGPQWETLPVVSSLARSQ
jgi:hypothetical protein